ncbi:Transcription cofactor vestigial-like protein 3 [Bagarius yarrelli]|uniref:Transcription cofactor vestigial-like protein 3 n=1 Tax=Bagarius yarrelli TaxID=175774 RepID=A0A556U4V2_BAGYA|nr:Transcription cofactor vestigial-like protein 3 [Bagarius yarrelli]
MSCLDVMYQNYGAHHYFPATAAAAAYKAAYYHQQQQKRLSAYSRMQDFADLPAHCVQSKQSEKHRPEVNDEEHGEEEEVRSKDSQPAETEYLSSRCVLFTYFRGDIGDVVDEHFSRALSQTSAFSNDNKHSKIPSGGLWKDDNSLCDGQRGSLPPSLWNSSYPSQTNPCVPSIHSDFPAAAAFHAADTGIWSGHSLTQPGLPPHSALTESWPYGLGGQSSTGHHHVHDMYPHMHPRHHHPHAHTHPILHHNHSSALDHRFSALLLPGIRPSSSPSNTEGIKTEIEPSTSSWPASFHGSVDIYDTEITIFAAVRLFGWCSHVDWFFPRLTDTEPREVSFLQDTSSVSSQCPHQVLRANHCM